MTRFLKATALTAVLLATGAASAAAQSAPITATANVLQAISVSGVRTLDFGNVFPGVAKSIGVTAATSGKFSATGQATANVNMTFALPADLVGPTNLSIGTWTGCYNGADDASSGCTSFTPSGSASPAAFGAAGTLYVFVGATVSPLANQAAGVYNGTVTMTLAYF